MYDQCHRDILSKPKTYMINPIKIYGQSQKQKKAIEIYEQSHRQMIKAIGIYDICHKNK
jgi:hypothetical protein